MIKFDHINIRADDQELVRDFICAALELKVGFRPDFDIPGYWLYLGDQAIVHMQARNPDAPRGENWVDHIAFGSYLFDEQVARLDALGLTYFIGGIPGTGIRQIFITGPEGIKIELQCHE